MTSGQSRPLAPSLAARIERWPIAGAFTISRGAKTEAVTVVAEVGQSGLTGRGECVPYPRYGETPEATLKALEAMQARPERGLDRQALQAAMPPGAARNALDCALLDLEAKCAGKQGLEPARPARAKTLHHGIHDLVGHAGGDGGGDRKGRAPAAAQNQAGGRWRRFPDCRGPQGRAPFRADRRRQRGLDARTILRKTWRPAPTPA